MEPQQYIRLSALNDMVHDAINSRFAGQRFWVLADITNHSYKADKKIHYFELVEKAQNGNAITAKMLGKSWGGGALRIEEFEKNTGQVFTNNLHVLVQVSVDYHPLYGLSVSVLDIDFRATGVSFFGVSGLHGLQDARFNDEFDAASLWFTGIDWAIVD